VHYSINLFFVVCHEPAIRHYQNEILQSKKNNMAIRQIQFALGSNAGITVHEFDSKNGF